jgi:hypothetical protein
VGDSTSPECQCDDGYELNAGTNLCVRPEIDPCDPNPCTEENKTKCIAVGVGDFAHPECQCDDGYELDVGTNICVRPEIKDVHIRAVAGNISTGNDQDYDAGQGIRIFQGLKPNVIMIQEFNYKNNTESDYEEMVKEVFQDPACFQDNTCFYTVGDRGEAYNNIPNGIISKFPILDSGYWDDPNIPDRDLDWAILDIPGDKELFTISVHLHTSPSADQIEAAQIIGQKISEIKELQPNKYYFIVGGDFNGDSSVDNDGFGEYNGEIIFDADIYGPRPIGEDGGYGTNASRTKPYDWVLTSPDLTAYQVSSDFCNINNDNDCMKYKDGLIFDTRDFTQEELDKYFSPTSFNGYQLETDDSDGSSMQHMAIVKDFIITF